MYVIRALVLIVKYLHLNPSLLHLTIQCALICASSNKGDPAKGNALPLSLTVAPGRTKKFRKTLTILDSTISSTDNMADELLQKPQNVKARLGTSHTDQFAYYMIFIKKKRNTRYSHYEIFILARERSINMYQKHLFQYVFVQYGLIHMVVKKGR
ncbi:hypothetical protein V1477_021039 [Vespula maculifrons]|uniref:Uncharacterized protein n=1 Tax=Vespula maculifrons TaxID=7453 RepID=A0ABD2AGZ2_VESMC